MGNAALEQGWRGFVRNHQVLENGAGDLPGKSCQHWGSSRHSPGKLLPQGESVAYTLREVLATKQSLCVEVLSHNSKACTMQSFCYTTPPR